MRLSARPVVDVAREEEVEGQNVYVYVCVFGWWGWGGVDQSEVVLETVVTAPNLLNQLPSVLTDTAFFSPQKELSSASLSPPSACFLSLSLPAACLFVFTTHIPIFFFCIFYAAQWKSMLLRWIPSPNPFVPGFLPLCNLCKPYHSAVSLFSHSAVTCPPKQASSHFLLSSPVSRYTKYGRQCFPCRDCVLLSCQAKLCQEDVECGTLSSLTAAFQCGAL